MPNFPEKNSYSFSNSLYELHPCELLGRFTIRGTVLPPAGNQAAPIKKRGLGCLLTHGSDRLIFPYRQRKLTLAEFICQSWLFDRWSACNVGPARARVQERRPIKEPGWQAGRG